MPQYEETRQIQRALEVGETKRNKQDLNVSRFNNNMTVNAEPFKSGKRIPLTTRPIIFDPSEKLHPERKHYEVMKISPMIRPDNYGMKTGKKFEVIFFLHILLGVLWKTID